MKSYFLKLYQYNVWATKRVINCLEKQQVNDEKILSIMGHIVAAQFLWLHRIKGLPPAQVKLWGEYKLPKLITMADEAGKLWLEFVESTENFNRDLPASSAIVISLGSVYSPHSLTCAGGNPLIRCNHKN